MDSERRYTEEEVSEILDRATEAQTDRTSTSSGATGLTLRELHEIGREVGISEDVITRAATSLDLPRPQPTANETFLGQTIGVGRTAYLPRPLTDHEWHRLVVDLRETFDAEGKTRDEGAFRRWANGNLQALVEPTDQGTRLRLRTLKGNARTYQGIGAAFTAASAGIGIASLLGFATDPGDALVMAALGVSFFLWSRLTVPSWARTRARQFDELIGRVTHSVAASPGDPDTLAPGSSRDDRG